MKFGRLFITILFSFLFSLVACQDDPSQPQAPAKPKPPIKQPREEEQEEVAEAQESVDSENGESKIVTPDFTAPSAHRFPEAPKIVPEWKPNTEPIIDGQPKPIKQHPVSPPLRLDRQPPEIDLNTHKPVIHGVPEGLGEAPEVKDSPSFIAPKSDEVLPQGALGGKIAPSPVSPKPIGPINTDPILDIYAFEADPEIKIPAFHNWFKVKDKTAELFEFPCRDCPKSFANVLSLRGFKKNNGDAVIKQCQGALIDDDLFVTNRHCVPKNILDGSVACSDRIFFVFPKLGENTPAKVLGCSQLIAVGDRPVPDDGTNKFLDYALFRTSEPLPNRVVETKTEGIPEGTRFYTFLPLKKQEDGEVSLNMIQCQAFHKSLNYPGTFSAQSPFYVGLCDHSYHSGYSGSAIYIRENNQWKQVGINTYASKHQFPQDDSNKIYYDGQGINISCIPELSNDPVHEDCEIQYPIGQFFSRKILLEETKRTALAMKDLFREEIAKSESMIDWQELDQIQWNDYPSRYQSLYDSLLLSKSYLKGTDALRYAEILSPYIINCIKESGLDLPPIAGQYGTAKIPRTHFRMVFDELGRLTSHYSVEWFSAKVLKNRTDGYFFRSVSMLPPRSPLPPGEDRFRSYLHSEFEQYFPTCSGGTQ